MSIAHLSSLRRHSITSAVILCFSTLHSCYSHTQNPQGVICKYLRQCACTWERGYGAVRHVVSTLLCDAGESDCAFRPTETVNAAVLWRYEYSSILHNNTTHSFRQLTGCPRSLQTLAAGIEQAAADMLQQPTWVINLQLEEEEVNFNELTLTLCVRFLFWGVGEVYKNIEQLIRLHHDRALWCAYSVLVRKHVSHQLLTGRRSMFIYCFHRQHS